MFKYQNDKKVSFKFDDVISSNSNKNKIIMFFIVILVLIILYRIYQNWNKNEEDEN